jgi:transcriptional regulator with XRE-family HTH domain
MANFDSKVFGENIRKYRNEKGLSQQNLADLLKKNRTTICRFESGEILPNAEEISVICDELGIYESDLFNRDYAFSNKKNVENPFGTDTLYVYFNAYNTNTKKFNKDKWIIKIKPKTDRIEVNFINSHDKSIYSTGYMLTDDMVAFLSFENYKPNQMRLDICEMVIRVCYGTDELMLGAYFGTNAQYEPSIRKCYFSKKDIEFTDEMFENLKPTDSELQNLKKNYALYLDIFKK